MPKLSADGEIAIECLRCGYKFQRSLGVIDTIPMFNCPSCNGIIRSDDSEILRAIEGIVRQREQLGERFRHHYGE
jgi:uncharacterized C2H2 Zn-finger protein